MTTDEIANWIAHCDEQVLAENLNCPLPLLKTKRALARLAPGQKVYLRATDPNTLRDLAAFADEAGHSLLLAEASAGVFHLVLEKGAAQPKAI